MESDLQVQESKEKMDTTESEDIIVEPLDSENTAAEVTMPTDSPTAGPSDVTAGLNDELFPVSLGDTDPAVLEKFTYGILAAYLPQLQKAKGALQELTEHQRILVETVQQENSKFGECPTLKEVTAIMNKAKVYHTKLLSIKKDMTVLHEKSTKLKKRALRLQQQKQKEALQQEQDREREMERERQLIAKPSNRKKSS